jgi:predicted NAD/FAD-dependent oxidoreductase
MTIAIVGAGMAGLACAERLVNAGRAVVLFDKAAGAGGRMAVRRLQTPLGPVEFDQGAQYFTARSERFRQRLDLWLSSGHARPWPPAGADAFVGDPSMAAPLTEMASALPVRWSCPVDRLDRSSRGWTLAGPHGEVGSGFEGLVLALPAEQAADLVGESDPDDAARAASARSMPCWTLMAAFSRRLDTDHDCLRTGGPISWAARNSSKPGRQGPEAWVIQAAPLWSAGHLDAEPAAVSAALLAAFFEAVEVAPRRPIAQSTKRWRFARSGLAPAGPLFRADLGLGLCGDWRLGPRVENAYLSGDDMAQALLGVLARS